MIGVLGDQNVRQQRGPGHAARDRSRRRGRLGNLLAAPARLLEPDGLDDLQPGGHEFQDLRDVLAQQPQLATAFRAGLAGVEHMALARRILGDPRLAAPARERTLGMHRAIGGSVVGLHTGVVRGDLHFERFERQLKLFDLALDLLGGASELLAPQPCDPDLQGLDQRLIGLDGGLQPRCRGTLGQE